MEKARGNMSVLFCMELLVPRNGGGERTTIHPSMRTGRKWTQERIWRRWGNFFVLSSAGIQVYQS